MTKVASTMAKEPNLRAIGALDLNEGSLKVGGGGVREIGDVLPLNKNLVEEEGESHQRHRG